MKTGDLISCQEEIRGTLQCRFGLHVDALTGFQKGPNERIPFLGSLFESLLRDPTLETLKKDPRL